MKRSFISALSVLAIALGGITVGAASAADDAVR